MVIHVDGQLDSVWRHGLLVLPLGRGSLNICAHDLYLLSLLFGQLEDRNALKYGSFTIQDARDHVS